MKPLWLTGVIVLCAVAAVQSAQAAAPATQINVYSDSYAPVKSRTITVTAQLSNDDGLPVNDEDYQTFIGSNEETVHWTVSNGSYSITATSLTNAQGYATATLTVPSSAGQSCTVTASVTSANFGTVTGTSNTITSIASAGTALRYNVTTTNYEPVLSTSYTITAQLVDADNNPVGMSGRSITWSTTQGSGGTFSGAVNTDTNGKATVSFKTGATNTTYVLKATDSPYTSTSLPLTTCSAAPTGEDVLTTPLPYFIDYARIQNIFDNKCTGCHSSGGGQTPFYTSPNSYTTIYGKPSSYGIPLISTASDATNSMIYHKTHEPSPLSGSGGGRMPANPSPYFLNAGEQQIIRDWINQGAPNKTVSNFQVTVSSTNNPPNAGDVVTITAQLRDSTNTACSVPGMLVTWSKTGTNGTFTSAATRTDASGKATVTFTTDTVSGRTYTFTATSGTLTGTSSSISTVPGTATKYIVTSSDTTPLAGATQSVTAQLVDQYNNNVSAVRSVTWSHSNVASGASFSSNSTSTNGSGLASVNFIASTTAGISETVTANDGSVSGTSATIQTQSATYQLTITQSPPYTVGQTINITAQLKDSGGNVLEAGHVVTFSANGPGGTFTPSTPQTTNASGQASVAFKTSNTAGNITITATEGTSTGNVAITNNPGAATAYIVTVPSTTPTVNTTFTADAQLVDAFNNSVSTSGLSVTWSATGQGGTFTGSPSTTDSSGHTTVSFKCATTAGATTLTATDTSSRTGSKGITAQAGLAAKYVVSTSTSMTVGTGGHAVTAQLADSFGNSVSGLRTVTWSATGVGGNFSSPTSATNASGLASVTFTASTIAGTATINAADGTYQGNSSTITINPGAANKYIVTSSTSSPVAGSGVTINAQLADSFGNSLTTSGLTVGWSLTAGTGGSFSSPTSATNSSGIATVTFTTSTTAGTAYTVQALESTHSGTASFTSGAGTPVACPLTVVPTNPVAGASVSISGQLKDANGNNVSRAGFVIIWSSDASGAFAQGTSTSDASGQVSVNFTTGPKANVTYNITATDGAFISGSAAPFTSLTGPASAYIVSVNNTAPIAGSAVTVSAQLVDAKGNAVAIAGQIVAWAQTGTGGTFATPTSSTDASGVATVSFTSAKTSGTLTTVSATTGAFRGGSPNITTINGPATKYLIAASSTSVAAGSAVRVSAQLMDANGNTVPTAGKTVTWSLTGANGFFSTLSSDTNSSGLATVVLSTSPSGGVDYLVTGTDADGLTGTSPTISVAVGSALTGLSPLITSPLTAETSVGANFSYPITVTGDQPITFSASDLPGGLVLSGDTITGSILSAGTYVVHVTASNSFGTDAIDLVIVAAPLQAASIDRAQVKLNFAGGSDSLTALFTLTLPDGTDSSNAVVSVQFGAVTFADMTTAAALKTRVKRAVPGVMSTTLTVKPAVKGSSSLMVSLNVKNANLKDALAKNGLVNDDKATTVTVPIVLTMKLDAGTFYCGGDAVLQYKAKKNKAGLARK